MPEEVQALAERLREVRTYRQLSQRELSELSGVPQSQISRIEAGLVDLRASSLVALANALSLEVTLVPRQAMPALHALLHGGALGDEPQPAYTLDDDDFV